MYSGKYLVKNKLLKFYLYMVYYLSFPIRPFVKKDIGNTNGIKRVLVANGAHLGDITILISSVNVLKASNPELKVDLVTGSWNKPVIEYYDIFDEVYYVDHWRLNRSKKSIILKLLQYYKTFIKSYFLVRKRKYTLTIDTYHFYPNSSLFLFVCGIKNSLGYSSGGFDNFYSETIKWVPKSQSIAAYHIELFKKFFDLRNDIPFYIHPSLTTKNIKWLEDKKYAIVHPGAGDKYKLLDIKKWRELIFIMQEQYDLVLLTGAGDADYEICKNLEINNSVINLCNKLNLYDLANILEKAQLLVCLDSFVSHFAAQFKIYTICITDGRNNLQWWKPINENCIQITQAVKCSPCYLSRGCNDMNCIADIKIECLNDMLLNKNKFITKA